MSASSFYDGRPHTTVDGRIVYKRKKHNFGTKDAVRVFKAVMDEANYPQGTGNVMLNLMITHWFIVYSHGIPKPNQTDYTPFDHPYVWLGGKIDYYLEKLAFAAAECGGDPDKFEFTFNSDF